MPNEIKITVELCAEDRGRLDKILQALTATPLQYAEPEPEAPAAEQKEEPRAVTLPEIQALVQKLIAPGSSKREQTKETVRRYADRVSAIPEDKWAEVYEALTALKEA